MQLYVLILTCIMGVVVLSTAFAMLYLQLKSNNDI